MLIPPKKQSNFISVLNFFLQVWGTVFASKPGSHAEYTVATEKEVMIKLKLLVAIYNQGGQCTSYIRVFFYRKVYNGRNFSTI